MQQQSLTQRLQNVRERCMSVSGGVNAVAKEMGRSKTTLHNWFKGVTTPTVDDIEALVTKVAEMEQADADKKAKEEARLNDLLGNQDEQLSNVLTA